MDANILLEAEDLDGVIKYLVDAVKTSTRKADPLPESPEARAALLAGIEKDCSAWQSVLLELLTAISREKRATSSIVLSLGTPYDPVKLDGLKQINHGGYLRYCELPEVQRLVTAIDLLWKAQHYWQEWAASLPVFWAQTRAICNGEMEIPREVRKDRKCREVLRKLQSVEERNRGKVLFVLERAFGRHLSLEQMRDLLSILREFFAVTDSARKRIAVVARPAISQEATLDVSAAIERSRIEEEVRSYLAAVGLAPDRADRLTDSQQMYVVWMSWRRHIEPARIRDKWNSEFPHAAIQGDKKAGSNHVRTGIKRAESIILGWKSK